jgi:hypothetical protein
MWLAGTLAAAVTDVPGAAAKITLVRQARIHAWHAELWTTVVPVVHDFSTDVVEIVAEEGAEGARPESILEQLHNDYKAWRADASPVAEAPILRVLLLVMRDHDDEGRA